MAEAPWALPLSSHLLRLVEPQKQEPTWSIPQRNWEGAKNVSKNIQQKSIHFEVDIPEQMIIIKSGFNWFIKIPFFHGKQISPCGLLACGTSTAHLQTFLSLHICPETFILSLKYPPHSKVLFSASLLVSLSTGYTGKETFKGSTEDTCCSEKSLKRCWADLKSFSTPAASHVMGWSPQLHLPAQELVPALGKKVARNSAGICRTR